jgi:adenylate kinase family enzyme
MVHEKKIEGISDIRELSNREGLRIEFQVKKEANANVVLNTLFKYTALQSSFSINNVALVGGRPRTLTLKDMLAKMGQSVTACVSIMIPDSLIHERIAHRAALEGRADDARDEVVSNRIQTYHAKTEPLINYYKKAVLYKEIDGVGTIEEVRDRIFSEMDKF